MQSCDFLVIGAGIAGAYAADALANLGKVVVIEMESRPGYHTTGRSAAIYSETYGNRVIRALTTAGKKFFHEPPEGFSDVPLVTPRGALHIGRADQTEDVLNAYNESSKLVQSLQLLDQAAIMKLVPPVNPDEAISGYLEPDSHDIDVNALHQGFLRSLQRRGGRIVPDSEALAITTRNSSFEVETRSASYVCGVLVNAAGAWADQIAELAGLPPLGLQPMRRTAVVFDPGSALEFKSWPLVVSIDESFYFKPLGEQLMVTPADESNSPPCDAQPEDIDVAEAIYRFERATNIKVGSISRKWAGLRTFAPDRSPVIGPDPENENFFWVAGQGGYGMQTAPSLHDNIREMMAHGALARESLKVGLELEDISPARLRS